MTNQTDSKTGNPMQPTPGSNPALKELGVLAGDWEMELSNSAFLPKPTDTVKGDAYIEWVEGGAFLEVRQGGKRPTPPDAIWLIGRDESSGKYEVLYFDARGVSRIYQMSFEGSVWKMWREAPGFSQRYEGKLSEDGNIMSGHWEKSSDGLNWEHDFDITYTK